MNAKRRFYEEQAKKLLKDLLADKGLTHRELAAKLYEHGIYIETQPLINKLNRGRYSFAFALQVLAALGEKSLRIPKLPRQLTGRRPPHPEPFRIPKRTESGYCCFIHVYRRTQCPRRLADAHHGV